MGGLALWEGLLYVVSKVGARVLIVLFVIVKLSRGTPSVLVNRTVAADALRAERNARLRCARGTRRLIAFEGAAEVQSKVSNNVSMGSTLDGFSEVDYSTYRLFGLKER